ncbi:type II CRISPR RNA-guided endonuclease Cas9 [Roseivirga echinicomitans]
MDYTLGLDMGTNSIGWALINTNSNTIVNLGVRIFQAGVENLGEGENEISRNASRTAARGTRRQFFRRKMRKRLLLNLLQKNRLAPQTDLSDWFKLNPYQLRAKALSEKLTIIELGRIFYHMIQRRGFQSNSRQNNSEEGKIFSGDSKIGKVGIDETRSKIEDYKTLGSYLNEIYPSHGKPFENKSERIRNRYTTRQMYIDEFQEIWKSQSSFHKELSKELKVAIGGRKKAGDDFDGILFHQRPLKSQKFLVGKCSFEPTKTKCPLSAIPFEKFRAWDWINRLQYNGKSLNNDQKAKTFSFLISNDKKVEFSKIRKHLGLLGEEFQFNVKDSDKITTCPTIGALSNKKFFGSKWNDFTEKEQEDIWHALYSFEDQDFLMAYARDHWDFNEKQQNDITKFTLVKGYSSLSRKAIKNILPFLAMGFMYDQAVVLGGIKNTFGDNWKTLSEDQKELIITNVPDIIKSKRKGGFIEPLKEFLKSEFDLTERQTNKLYHHSSTIQQSEVLTKLPVSAAADREIQNLRNPIVITALFELRKLINAIIEKYGLPAEIKVEMARDLKNSKSKRQEIELKQRKSEEFNLYVKDELAKMNIQITHENILRYKLWLECQKHCPYTGKQIGLGKGGSDVLSLFDGNKVVDIEHIHPWSRSINDSFQNKTLCDPDYNRAKGDKTPYEYINNLLGEAEWIAVKQRALKLFRNRYDKTEYFPDAYRKFLHFVKKEHPDDFTSRHLNDTRFISKEAKNYLSKICKNVIVSPGQVTSKLRHHWGLNTILQDSGEKERTDHRHHAIDALTLACTERKYLSEISKWNRYDRNYDLEKFPDPWDGFRTQAMKAVDGILISNRKNNKVLTTRNFKVEKNGRTYTNNGVAARGQLHKESVFGKRVDVFGNEAYHIRKPLESITTSTHVNKIVDPMIKKLILSHLENIGVDITQKFTIPKGAFFDFDNNKVIPKLYLPNKNGQPIPIKKVRVKENIGKAEQLKEGINQHVNPMNNHHVLIYKDIDGNLNEEVVTFWTAVERKRQGQTLIQLPPNQRDGKIIYSLEINDYFLLGMSDQDFGNAEKGHLSDHLYRVQKLSSSYYMFRKHIASTLTQSNEEQSIRSFKSWLEHNPIKVIVDVKGDLKRV